MGQEREDIVGLDESELIRLADSLGQPAYRGRQLFSWLYGKRAGSFEEMTDLPREFREQLADRAWVARLEPQKVQRSVADGTTKFLFRLGDGLRIETVLIPSVARPVSGTDPQPEPQERRTLCVSTQVGCPLDCAFCATASMGFQRNLTAGEIVAQVLSAEHQTDQPLTNIVFMGMGEPLMNYGNVMKAAELLVAGAGFAPRRITVSTAGRIDRVRQMADEGRKFKLALSLHSAVEETRKTLMPITKKFSVRMIGDAIEYYYRTTGRTVTLEQTFFDGVNDSEREVAALIRFARRVSSRVNVIPFHSIQSTKPVGFSASLRPSSRVDSIVQTLRDAKVPTFVRRSAGIDIDAACGQLAVRTQPEEGPAVSS